MEKMGYLKNWENSNKSSTTIYSYIHKSDEYIKAKAISLFEKKKKKMPEEEHAKEKLSDFWQKILDDQRPSVMVELWAWGTDQVVGSAMAYDYESSNMTIGSILLWA